MKAYPIDFVRQIIEQTMLEEHLKNPSKYFGGINQVSLFSFYEQLQQEDEVNRFVEIYRDLTEQQNRTGLIMNGTILAPENPTITNINSALIIPMSFTCAFRVKLADRDIALDTLNNLIDILKGRSHDIAELDTGKLFKVGRMGNNINGLPLIKIGSYIGGGFANVLEIEQKLQDLDEDFIFESSPFEDGSRYYYAGIVDGEKEQIKLIQVDENDTISILEDDGSYGDYIFPPTHESYTKYKVSMSFESVRCDEPRTLNSEEYCVISIGGSATLVSESVALGNDLTKVGIAKYKIVAQPEIMINGNINWLEPLELPNTNNADTQINQLISNNFIQNTHTDALTINMQYSFVLDKSNDLLKQFFKYARYGTQADGENISYQNGITPNMIYSITELWSYWGNYEFIDFYAKVVESVEIQNTESDTLSISIPFQVQGANN
jgi:hypothetical protein